MQRMIRKALVVAVLIVCLLFSGGGVAAEERKPVVDVITISAAITPPVAEYVLQSIDEAGKGGAEALIIRLDTPGGLDLAMRDIAKGILNAPLPVIVYVAPSGARAASAGLIITVAAHIAAMAPGTNIGAAHPVGLGIGDMDKTMSRKVENDAVAYVWGIAKQRGRNEEWMEKGVRKSESIPAEEALHLKVIDLVATDMGDLLIKADGREVSLAGGKKLLRTKGAILNEKTMGTRQKILSALSDPNIAYILLLIGLAGLYFEFSNPGAILPGVIGGISLILAFFGMQTLPVNYAGIVLILFSIVLFIAEIKIISHGLLTVGGIVSLVIGSLMLFQTSESSPLRVSWSVPHSGGVDRVALLHYRDCDRRQVAAAEKAGWKRGDGRRRRAGDDRYPHGGKGYDPWRVLERPERCSRHQRVQITGDPCPEYESQGRAYRKIKGGQLCQVCTRLLYWLFWSSCSLPRPFGSLTSMNGLSSSVWEG